MDTVDWWCSTNDASGISFTLQMNRYCITHKLPFVKCKGKGHPVTGQQEPRGGVEV
jgi:hypothetical protein